MDSLFMVVLVRDAVYIKIYYYYLYSFSRKIIWIRVAPSNSNRYYLEAVEEISSKSIFLTCLSRLSKSEQFRLCDCAITV